MFRYAPAHGDPTSWGLVSDRFLLVLGADESCALRMWDTLSAQTATLEDVLEALAAGGVRATPDFALVELVDAPTGSVSVALRGRGRADLGGSADRRLSGSGAGSWLEASAQGIAGLAVGLEGAGDDATRLPMARGIVPTARVSAGPDPVRVAVAPATTPIAAPGQELRSESPDRTVDLLEEATILSARRAPAAQLRFDDGSVVRLDGTLTLGRSPRPAGRGRVHVLPSPHKEVSGTHAAVEADGGVLRLRDLGSTNGTTLTFRASGSSIVLRGAGHALAVGDRIDFGDGNAAVVEAVR